MERENTVPENRPPVSYGPVTWGQTIRTKRMQLKDQGVDVTTSENQELQRLFEPLDEFRSNWMNEVTNRGSYRVDSSAITGGICPS